MLQACDVRAMFFADGQITRQKAGALMDLMDEGHEVGFSGLRGIDPQKYSALYGQQKYFQDEIIPQVLGARDYGVNPHYYLLRLPDKAKPEVLKLPSFLVSKGFTSVIDLMPSYIAPQPSSLSELRHAQTVHAYQLTTNVFDRAQIASLAHRNEILVVAPDRQVLPDLVEAAHAQSVPFATLADLRR